MKLNQNRPERCNSDKELSKILEENPTEEKHFPEIDLETSYENSMMNNSQNWEDSPEIEDDQP